MFSAPIYLLLTISIVIKYADGYVVDNSASMRNETKSQTDDRPTAYFDSNNESNNNNVVVDNHIRTSTINATAIDNVMEMPKPNVVVDYSTFRASRDASDALDEVETGERNAIYVETEKMNFLFSQSWFFFNFPFFCPYNSAQVAFR